MTKDEYLQFHRESCDRMVAITKAKNADYTGTDKSPFANFSRTELNGVCSTEQGFLVRMGDKFARITSFVQKGILEVKDESVEDTLLDLANYCILMAGYLREKRHNARHVASPDLRKAVREAFATTPMFSSEEEQRQWERDNSPHIDLRLGDAF